MGAVTGLAGLAGCLGSLDGENGDDGSTERPGSSAAGTDSPLPDGSGPPLADRSLPVTWAFEELRGNVQSGGPAKDGIPSIDDPAFVTAENGDGFLAPEDVVFGLTGETETKAYPQSILVWHEIVNDTVDDLPVSVTYCPLTGTTLGFERGETTFGTSGNLLNNNLVMYDRATDSRWPQVLGTAIRGPLEGQSLREVRLVWTTWRQWKTEHPETIVLSRDTGHARNYNRDPYGQYGPKRGYYAGGETLFPPLSSDGRYGPKEVVMGTRIPEGAMAFYKPALREAGVLSGSLDGTTYIAVHDTRFDSAYVYRNQEDVAVSLDNAEARLDGSAFTPATLPLERVHTFDAMWFAWSGFYPETVVVA
jgi:hypothetical protein